MKKFFSVVGLLLIWVNLFAQAVVDDSKKEEAKRHFELGKTYYKQSEYNKAIDEFQKAYGLYPHSVILYNIAQAYEKEGNIPMALRFFREYLRASPDAEDKNVILISIQNLEKKLQEKGIQQVGIYSTPPEADVAINGKVVGKTPFTIELTPGKYTLSLTKKGYLPIDKEFVVVPDKSIELDFSLTEMNVGTIKSPDTEAKQPKTAEVRKEEGGLVLKESAVKGEDQVERRSGRVWTYIVGGAGGLMVSSGLVFGIMADSAESDLQSSDNMDRTQQAAQSLADDARNYATIANILYGAGAAALISATVLFFLEDTSTPQKKEQAFWISPSSNGAMITFGGNF